MGKFQKQKKPTKLKEKTQALGGFRPAWETKWCYKNKKSLIYGGRFVRGSEIWGHFVESVSFALTLETPDEDSVFL